MKKKIPGTGGSGFIGSEFVKQGLRQSHHIAVIDKLSYAGCLDRLKDFRKKFAFYKADICQKDALCRIKKNKKPLLPGLDPI